jgi:membrane protein required for colicin V production
MNFIDIILILFLLFGFIKGVWNGFFTELASFISLLVGLFIAIKFSGFTADFIRENYATDIQHLEIIAFAITFILVVIGIILLAKVFTKVASFTGLGWINRLLGGVFGLLKMIFILSVVLHFFTKINQEQAFIEHDKINQSILFKPIIAISDTVFPVLTEWFNATKEAFSEEETST